MKLRQHLPYLFWGLAFGFIIARSGATRFDYINAMFLLQEAGWRLYGIIGSAIAVAMPGIFIMKRLQRSWHKHFAKIHFPSRRFTKGTIPGAFVFGLGWALTGTCPGPAVIQLGEGHSMALFTIAGIFIGNWLYGVVHQRYFDWSLDFCS